MLRVMQNDWSPMYTIKWFDWWISDDVSIVSLLFCSWRFPLYEQKPLHSLNNIIRTWFSSHDQIILSMNIKINCHSSQDRITNDRHYFLRVIHFQYFFALLDEIKAMRNFILLSRFDYHMRICLIADIVKRATLNHINQLYYINYIIYW